MKIIGLIKRIGVASLLVLFLVSIPAYAQTSRVEFKRGSVLMWTKDIIEWTYNGSTISSSYAYQQKGYIFPNIARVNGIFRISTTSTMHRYRGDKTIGAGIVTPWGDVTVYETDYSDYYRVYGSGSYLWE
ncbi:hypothetical protein [Fonticella tunisiensis]|uniref:Uncharacterized protein n=1 Tax=Fonticella tunisiensis TaxID=1096341 RepID=A0A4R7KU82_9CLOT|nr:hypothetical protein [Fonticella tunisiensis]TDT62810.1 hypothetical protein EDD71_10383 [Fonticella tunisiensis]